MPLLPEIFSAPLARQGTLADIAVETPPTATEFKKFRKLTRRKRKQSSRQSRRTPKK